MKRFAVVMFAIVIAVTGCNEDKATKAPTVETKTTVESNDVKGNLDKLSAEDRTIAAAQKLCPVTDEPLGSMGVPIKLTIKDQPVFICCKSCEKGAKKDPDKTLQTVTELKAKSSGKDK
jgi:hypothetical protein